jgi:hypothetical protein
MTARATMRSASFAAAVWLGLTGLAAPTRLASDPVPILTTVTESTFPASWKDGDVAATAEPLDGAEVSRSLSAVRSAMAKYPSGVVEGLIKRVFILRRMTFYGLDYGGTNSRDTVYLTNQGEGLGYTDDYLRSAFHHELSSIVLRNRMDDFDSAAWNQANPPGFQYGAGGTEALRTGRASTEIDPALCEQGFLSQYSTASLEEDFNMVAENLFMGDAEFWECVDASPRLNRKVGLVIGLYGRLDPSFDLRFFRGLAR